jgi:branched-subunit amino acid aminotransferase/4-amino-4-deoxychorismate lyase
MAHVATYRATLNGVEKLAVEAHTLDEATLQIPDGAYTVVPIFEGGRVMRLDRHFERTDNTVRLLGIDNLFDHAQQRRLMRECVAQSGIDTARVRLTLPEIEPGVAYLSVEPWQPYGEELYEFGVRVVTTSLQREAPRAKSTHFIRPRSKLLSSLPEGIHEAILLSPEGALLEGSNTNFYAVHAGSLRTAEEGMLRGIARSTVLDACALEPPLSLSYEPVNKNDLGQIGEAMLSSVSRGVVPIVEIDGEPVGEGMPGPVFAELHRRYRSIFEQELEPL